MQILCTLLFNIYKCMKVKQLEDANQLLNIFKYRSIIKILEIIDQFIDYSVKVHNYNVCTYVPAP